MATMVQAPAVRASWSAERRFYTSMTVLPLRLALSATPQWTAFARWMTGVAG